MRDSSSKGRIPQESNQETCTNHLQLFSAEIKFKTSTNKKTGSGSSPVDAANSAATSAASTTLSRTPTEALGFKALSCTSHRTFQLKHNGCSRAQQLPQLRQFCKPPQTISNFQPPCQLPRDQRRIAAFNNPNSGTTLRKPLFRLWLQSSLAQKPPNYTPLFASNTSGRRCW